MVTKTLSEVLTNPPMYGLNAAACDYTNGASRYIRITDITDDGKYFPTDNAYVLSDDERYLLQSNDIVLARTGASVGKSYLYSEKDGKLIFAGFLIRVSIDPQQADSRFIFECFHTKQYWDWVRSESARSGQPGINGQQYASYELQLPPLSEQRAIAAALSDTDAYIAALEKLITKKRAVKQGAMQELLTGKRRLPGFSGEWAEKPLGELSEIRMCKRIFSEQTSESGDVPFFKIGTFGKEPDAYIPHHLYEEYREKYSFPQKGDILLSAAGTLGRTVIYDGKPSYFQDSNIVWLELYKTMFCNEYLYHYYQVIEWASPEGSTISRLYNGIIRDTTIKLPPTLDEQTAIAEVLSDMDAEIDSLTMKMNKAKRIKQGMMSELLTGRIRLIEEGERHGEKH